MTRRNTEDVRVVCAWCKTKIRGSDDQDAQLSHGICLPCRAGMEDEVQAARAEGAKRIADKKNPGWWRAVHRYVSPRERPLTELEAWVRDVAYGIKNGVAGAITVAAEEMAKFVPDGSVIVPAPASKAGGYGGVATLADRVAELSRGISATLVSRETAVPSSHERRRVGGQGLAVEEHVASMKAAPGLEGRTIVLVDNVAMSGATLEAMRALLSDRSPDVRAVVWAEGVESQ